MLRLLCTPDKLLALNATRLPILRGANPKCGTHLLHAHAAKQVFDSKC